MIPEIEHDTIGGVPVLRAPASSGRTTAGLVFRVGQYDETLPVRGITHMVEHLTFAGQPDATFRFNASVGGRYTSFHAESADPADIRDFIGMVCRGLAADHRAALDRERTILRTEAASRGSAGVIGDCLVERYGAAGPGLANYQEFALERAGWDDVEAWRRQWFTAGNAALWIAGDLPDGLRIDLPDGPPPPAAGLRISPLDLPAYLTGARGGVGLSLVSPRGARYQVAMDALQRRLTQVLRHEHGTTYGVSADSDEHSRDVIHTWVAADALPEQVPMAAHAILTTLEALTDDGCDPDGIRDYARRAREACESPAAPAMLLRNQAHAVLSGRKTGTPEEYLAKVEAVTPGDVSEAVREFRDRMLIAVPGRVPAVDGRMDEIPGWSSATVTGHQLQSADSDATLTTGDDGVMLTAAPGRNVTVRYDGVAALLRWKDGGLAILGDDGFSVKVDPDEWEGGRAVPDAIAARVPEDKIIDLNEEGGKRSGRGRQARKPEPEPEPQAPAGTDRWAWLRQPMVKMRVIYALLFTLGLVGVILGIAGGALLMLANLIYWLRQESRYGFLRSRR